MKTFDQLETLWKKPQKLAIPAADQIVRKAMVQKDKLANRILLQVCCLLLSFVAICFVLYTVKFQYASSYFGIALMFICIIGFSVIRYKQAVYLRKMDFSQPPVKMLECYKQFFKKQKWVNSKGILIYSILLNIAFGFYFYETLIVAPFTNLMRALIFIIYCSWMLISIFYFGRRSIRREHEKSMLIMNKLRELIRAFERDLS